MVVFGPVTGWIPVIVLGSYLGYMMYCEIRGDFKCDYCWENRGVWIQHIKTCGYATGRYKYPKIFIRN